MKKKIFFICISLCLPIAFLEVALRFSVKSNGHVEHFLGKPWHLVYPIESPDKAPRIDTGPGMYRTYHPQLGWSTGALGADPPLYFSDRLGLRCTQSQHENEKKATNPPLKKYDVICLGDSFTHGDEVIYEHTWPYQLEKVKDLRVANLGVGGYGIDQAILRYRQRKDLNAPMVILGLISGDLERATTQVYNLHVGGLKTKPIFQFNNSQTSVVNLPTIHGADLLSEFELGVKSPFFKNEFYDKSYFFKKSFLDLFYLYRIPRSILINKSTRRTPIYLKDDESLAYCLNILKELKAEVAKRQARLLVVFLGNINSFLDRSSVSNPWELMAKKLAELEINTLDTSKPLYEIFKKDRNRIINKGKVHYTYHANQKVAKQILESGFLK